MSWIENIKDTYKNNEPRMYEDIAIEEIINALKYLLKWKLPGIDKITNFWLHHLSSANQLMAKLISEILKISLKNAWLSHWSGNTFPVKTKETTNTKKLTTDIMPFHCL